ncbi:amidohydrolase [Acidobacteria bacterium AH-259-D05]|nr:amidohydrolase [Acidobacteria bacterium AH-259-D05]
MKFVKITLTHTLWAIFLLLFTARCGSEVSSALAPDMVLYNGKIVTVDEDFSTAQAVAIKDGRFVAVGSDEQVLSLAGADTEKMDLSGRTVLPGFNDSHLHLAWPVGEPPHPAIRQLGKARSIEEILEVVGQKVAVTPPGELVWIPGGVARAAQIKEKRWPTRHDLDPVSPENPVILIFAADHVYVTNSLGLSRAKINRRTVQPYSKGLFGEFETDPRTGEPTGILTGRAAARILRVALNVWSTQELETNMGQAIETEVIPYGITSLSDPQNGGSPSQPIQHAYQRLLHRPEGLPARINLMIRLPVRSLATQDSIDLINSLLYAPPLENDFFRVGTFKVALDKGRPGEKPYIVPEEKGKQVLIEAHRKGWQLYVHITTPETFDYACQALEEAYRLYPREDVRHIFTHINQPTQENLQTMKRLGIIADLQVNSIYHLADDAEKRYQVNPERPDLGPRPVATYREAGIPVILSSDQAPIGPLFTLWEAVNRVRKSGKVFRPGERLTLEEAIRAITVKSAWAFFQDDVKGSIEIGKYADLVVLGRDILTIDPLGIKDIPVLMTMTGGKFVYVNPNQDAEQKVDYFRYPSRVSYLN